jgi:hypothetical protein
VHGLDTLGLVLLVIGNLWIAIKAFQEGILWGLACLIIPFASLLFVVLHWYETKVPFLIALAGTALMIFGK